MEYLLKSIACLLLFLLVHRLFLQQEVLHRFNRFYLLAAVLLSFIIPLNQIEISTPMPVHPVEEAVFQPENFPINEEYSPIEIGTSSKSKVSSDWDWFQLVFGVYIFVAIIFGIRFLRNFQVIRSKIRSNVQVNYRGQTLILLPEDTLPYSFLKYIFVSKAGFENQGLSDAIFEHERVHVVERHSWDLIFVELLLIPFWFHPGLYWAKHSIRLNHEFIADRSAILRTEVSDYQYQLIRLALSGTPSALVSTLNYSLTKKRIQMMTKKRNPMQVAWKFLAIIPILGLIYYGFSEKVNAHSDKKTGEVHIFSSGNEESEEVYDLAFYLDPSGKIYQEGEESQEYDEIAALDQWLEQLPDQELKVKMVVLEGNTTGNVAEAQAILANHDIRRIRIMDDRKLETSGENLSTSYKLVDNQSQQKMTKSQYYSQTKFILKYPDGQLEEMSYDELPQKIKEGLREAPGKIEPKAPTADVFESWKDGDEFALWLNQAVIPNSKLDEISRDEIVHYFSSFVHNNARSECFPQNYQVHLYTKEAFEKNFGESSDLRSKPLRGTVTIPVEEPKNQLFSSSSHPVSLYQQDLESYHQALKTGPHFVEKSQKEQEELMRQFLDLGGRYFRFHAPNKPDVDKPTHPFAPFVQLKKNGKSLFKLPEDLTESEKASLESAVPANAVSSAVKTYQKLYFAYEIRRNEKRHFITKTPEEQKRLLEEFEQVQNAYMGLDYFEKRTAVRPSNPSHPYVKLEEGGKATFKLIAELTSEERAALGC